jgi:toxin CptA
MHSAPAVTYPVGRSYFQTLLTAALLLATAAVIGLWSYQADFADWRQALAASAWLVGAALAWRSFRLPLLGILRWDGQNWHWESGGTAVAGMVVPQVDWQSGMLLEFRAPAHRVGWLWLERRAEPGRWEALRRAVWARASTAAPVLSADPP